MEGMTVKEVAEFLDLSRAHIYTLINRGVLTLTKDGLVDEKSVIARKKNPPRIGRPLGTFKGRK